MKKLFTITIFLALTHMLLAQDKPAYVIYTKEGLKTDYTAMMKAALKNEVVLFGEQHNNAIAHWLQLQLAKDMFAALGEKLLLGAEMFEADNQVVVNEYVSKLLPYKNFKADARLWNNFETDYKPLLDLARDSGLKFIATNIPRRYAALVNAEGFEGLEKLSNEAKKWIAPLPIAYDPELPGYKKMANMAGMGGGMPGKTSPQNLPKAQAVKDATMAYFILGHMLKEGVFLHFQGAYHSDNYEGICWYLKKGKPELKMLTISTVEQEDISTLDKENQNIADFIICIPADMTKTY